MAKATNNMRNPNLDKKMSYGKKPMSYDTMEYKPMYYKTEMPVFDQMKDNPLRKK